GANRLEVDAQRFGAVGGQLRLASPGWSSPAIIEVRGWGHPSHTPGDLGGLHVLTITGHPSFNPDPSSGDARSMQSGDPDAREYGLRPAPPLPSTLTTLFGSINRNGRFSVPPQLQLKTAFGELKLDLREALF